MPFMGNVADVTGPPVMRKTGGSRKDSAEGWTYGGLMFVVCLLLARCVSAGEPGLQESHATNSSSAADAPAQPKPEAQAAAGPEQSSNIGTKEIEHMVEAGVSKEVLKTYLENVRVTRMLSPSEIISLKEHGVPDEVTMVLLKRAGESKAQSPAQLQPRLALGQLDPDSYDFWWAHYGYPRVLASSGRIGYPFGYPFHAAPIVGPRAFWQDRTFNGHRVRYVTARPTGLGGVVERPDGGRPH